MKPKKLLRGRRKTDCLGFISPKPLQRQMGYCAFPELQRWVGHQVTLVIPSANLGKAVWNGVPPSLSSELWAIPFSQTRFTTQTLSPNFLKTVWSDKENSTPSLGPMACKPPREEFSEAALLFPGPQWCRKSFLLLFEESGQDAHGPILCRY